MCENPDCATLTRWTGLQKEVNTPTAKQHDVLLVVFT